MLFLTTGLQGISGGLGPGCEVRAGCVPTPGGTNRGGVNLSICTGGGVYNREAGKVAMRGGRDCAQWAV